MKLVQKFVLVSLLIALAPLTWVGVRLVVDVDRSLREAALRLQHSLANRTLDAVTNRLDDVVNLLAITQRQINPRDPKTGATLESLMNNVPTFVDLWVAGPSGNIQWAVHRLRAKKGWDDIDWARLKRQTEERGYFLSPVTMEERANPTLVAAVPVTAAGREGGFLLARVNLSVLNETLQGLDLGAGGRVFLTDDKGRVIATSLPEPPPPDPVVSQTPWGRPDWSEGAYDSFDRSPVLGVKATLKETGWVMIFEQPTEIALGPAHRAKRRVWVSIGIAAGFGIILAAGLGGFVTRPLRRFRDAVRNMQKGEFDTLIPFRSSDEIGDIAQALRDAQPALEKRVRDSVLGRMARLIGHDLRTPLLGLRQAHDQILDHVEKADETAVKYFKLSDELLSWIGDFIEDILTIGRDKPLTLRRTAVNDWVAAVLETLKGKDGPAVHTTFAAGLPAALLDEKEARKALVNAVKNALEATGAGGTVSVATAATPDHVDIVVQDTGPGIAPEKMGRLFEEWTSKESGSGLGLLVIKKVMDQHRGRVEVRSAAGQGTAVHLLFPRAEAG